MGAADALNLIGHWLGTCVWVCGCAAQLGFVAAAQQTYNGLSRSVQALEETVRAINAEAVDIPGVDVRLRTSPARFQMCCMGPDMPRELGSRPDARVPSFLPDDWQLQYVFGWCVGRRC